MSQKPNTDQSIRAQRRRAERAAPQAPVPAPSGAPGSFHVGLDEAARAIGMLTLERDALRGQVNNLTRLLSARSPAPEPVEDAKPEEKASD